MNWTLVIEILAVVVLCLAFIAIFSMMSQVLAYPKKNKYLPVGTVLLVKYDREDYGSNSFYSAVVENNTTTSADMNRRWQETYTAGKKIISYEYIIPPKA